MKEKKQGNSKEQNEKGNPEMAVRKDGFEHNRSLCRERLVFSR
ncbi:MAG: hypothetical protein WA400_06390 [Silvibacterium sp.]